MQDSKLLSTVSKTPSSTPSPGRSLLPTGQTQIDTPNDNNCLFWSAALALLMPLLGEEEADKAAFTRMYGRLFGTTGSIVLQPGKQGELSDNKPLAINTEATQEGIRQALKTYTFEKDDVLAFVGNPLHKLIADVFRRQVVAQMNTLFTEAEKIAIAVEGGCQDWSAYTLRMLQADRGWGGEAEIRAIGQLAQCPVRVHGLGAGYPKEYEYKATGATPGILLVHVNAENPASLRKNHYHYGIAASIYQAHKQNLLTCTPMRDEKAKAKTKTITPVISTVVPDKKDPPTTTPASSAHLSSSPLIPRKEGKIRLEDDQEDKPGPLTPPAPIQPLSAPDEKPLMPLPPGESKADPRIQHPALRRALQTGYQQAATLTMPLSEQAFPIQAVTLTISAKDEQRQRERERQRKEKAAKEAKEKKDLKEDKEDKDRQPSRRPDPQQGDWSAQIRWEEDLYKTDQPILVRDIFAMKDKDNPPARAKRVLVEGRAGVGKSTFSQYLAWQWGSADLFAQDYNYVLWIPLRKWLGNEIEADISFAEDVAQFVYDHVLAKQDHSKNKDAYLDALEAILTPGQDEHTLLILDGFDEVAHFLDEAEGDKPAPVARLLRAALQFKHLVLTTRDYQLPPDDIRFDRNVINIGFTDAQISAYIQTFVESIPIKTTETRDDDKKSTPTDAKSIAQRLETALKQNPHFWGLAHIPLNLALICQVMQADPDTIQNISLTGLYQQVNQQFLKRHIQRYGRKLPKIYDDETIRDLCPLELRVLRQLAWEGFLAHQAVLTPGTQKKALQTLRARHSDLGKGVLEMALWQAFDMGFLRGESASKPSDNPLEQAHYFIHLTFQEYFAADYLCQALQGEYGEAEYDHALQWISQHKYQPHTQVLLGFLSGLTTQPGYDQALKALWSALLSWPYDLLGEQHLRLVVRCLEEANVDERIPHQKRLCLELAELLSRASHGHNLYGCSWLWSLLAQSPRVLLRSGLINQWIAALQGEKEKRVREVAAKALGYLGAAAGTPEVLAALAQRLEDENKDVRYAAAEALGKLGTVAATPEVLAALVQRLEDEDFWVQKAAAKALGNLDAAAAILEVLTALVQRLDDKAASVRKAAASRLYDLGAATATPEVLIALVQRLEDKDKDVREAAAEALGELGKATAIPTVLASLVKLLENTEKDVREAAAKTLGKLGKATATPAVLASLVKLLENTEKDVREAAAEALGELGKATAIPEVLIALVQRLEDKDKGVRAKAICALGKLGTAAATPTVLTVLVQCLEDEDKNVKSAAAYALGQLGKAAATPAVLTALVRKLWDKEKSVQFLVYEALVELGVAAATPAVLTTLVRRLEHKDEHVRKVAVYALNCLGAAAATSAVITALVQRLEDEYNLVRTSAANTLGKLGTAAATPAVLTALVQSLEDEDNRGREDAAHALGNLGAAAATPEVLSALVRGLGDKNNYVGEAAAKGLNTLITEEVLPRCSNEFLQSIHSCNERSHYFKVSLPNVTAALLLENYLLHRQTPIRQTVPTTSIKINPFMSLDIIKGRLQNYLHQETPIRPTVSTTPMNLFLSILPSRIIYEEVNFLITRDGVDVQTATHTKFFPLTDLTLLLPLYRALQAEAEKEKLPALLEWEMWIGQTPRYPEARQPVFAAPRVAPLRLTLYSPQTTPSSGSKTPLNTPLRQRRIKKPVPMISPSPVVSTPTAAPESKPTATETEHALRQQLLYSRQRALLDTFLRDIKITIRRLARGFLTTLSSSERQLLLTPQVFISYAWEAWGTPKLKYLQEDFLRGVLSADFRKAGLNPWLDIEKMTGCMHDQMHDNVRDSQFVLLIGTQRYAERTQTEKCGLLCLPPSEFKARGPVDNLPIVYNNFYLRVGDQLFYVADKARNQCRAVELQQEAMLTEFDRAFQLTMPISTPYAKQLNEAELSRIVTITQHERRTNVRKELEFTLQQAKNSKDFLLPLLLEGEFTTTFPEIGKDYLIRDGRSWFSLERGQWQSFKNYIQQLTQSSPLGILPCLLGFSRSDYPAYRRACLEAYQQRERTLTLELEKLASEYEKPTALPEKTPPLEVKPASVPIAATSASASTTTSDSENSTTRVLATMVLTPKDETRHNPAPTPTGITPKDDKKVSSPLVSPGKSGLFGKPPRLKSRINGSVLAPGNAQVSFALPNADTDGKVLLYLESVSLQGVLKCTQYHLTYSNAEFQFAERTIVATKPLPPLFSTHEITAHSLTLEQSKALRHHLTEQEGQALPDEALTPQGNVHWETWFDQLHASALSKKASAPTSP